MNSQYKIDNYKKIYFTADTVLLEKIKSVLKNNRINFKLKNQGGSALYSFFFNNFECSILIEDESYEFAKQLLKLEVKEFYEESDNPKIANLPFFKVVHSKENYAVPDLKKKVFTNRIYVLFVYFIILSASLILLKARTEYWNFDTEFNIKKTEETVNIAKNDDSVNNENSEIEEETDLKMKEEENEKISHREENKIVSSIDGSVKKKNYEKLKADIGIKFSDKRNLIKTSIKKNPEEFLGIERNAVFYYNSEMYKESLDIYRSLIHNNPENAEYKLYAAKCCAKLGLYNESLNLLNEIKNEIGNHKDFIETIDFLNNRSVKNDR